MAHPEMFNKRKEIPEDELAKREFNPEMLKQEGLSNKEIDLLRVARNNKFPESAKGQVAKNFEQKLDSTLLDKIKWARAERELEGEI